MKPGMYFIPALVTACMICVTSASSGDQLGTLYRINGETEAKIQAQVLDRMLGPGKAYVFLEMKAELKSTSEKESKEGAGEVHVKLPPGSAVNKTVPGANEDGEKAVKDKMSEQLSRQSKQTEEKKNILRLKTGSMQVRILYDAAIPEVKLKAVKEALVALYPEKTKPEDIVFVAAAFVPVP